ncbi:MULTISPECIES: nitroreductase family protein [Streptomyces]|uniref:Nitroreductase family protein n=1 Tax=Streptomyces chartreusis NRRL 3882 TaxID=1079985 RepID=A0A2N9BCR3_STRCX|nr:nitroreductase family protein [Streptomyces chartreusis]SOR81148.1 Nitroreductase family protein [Streptomyces chartreusis NRRL 3882]
MTAPAEAWARRAPVDLPGPEGDNSIAREPLWYAYGAGDDRPEPPPWTWAATPPPDSHVPPPPPRPAGPATLLPLGTTDRLSAMPYPRLPAGAHPAPDALLHALTATFAPLRREPENPYNEHRPYASPRCLFPVHAFVGDGDAWRLLEPTRHTLTGPGTGTPSRIALTGRYTAIPLAYQWFRGSLVAIETGMVLRALTLGLELFGVPATLTPPTEGASGLLRELGVEHTWEWSLPWLIDVGEPRPAVHRPAGPESPVPDGDPSLTQVIDVDRSAVRGTGPHPIRGYRRVGATSHTRPAPVTTAVPPTLPHSLRTPTWSELLWHRHSGRMPRSLHGMDSAKCHTPLPARTLATTLAWLGVPPPHPLLAAAFDAVTVTAVVQHVDGHTPGVHRVRDGSAHLVRDDPTAPAGLEANYGYGLTPVNGCGIANAPLTVFFSVRPRELFARFGPTGWSAAQHACGWAVHGLCLAAAAEGLFARPVRAFKEIQTKEVVGLGEDETIVLSAVVGVPRETGGAVLDLRT